MAVFISPSECSACVRGVSRSAARGFAAFAPQSMQFAKSRISYLGRGHDELEMRASERARERESERASEREREYPNEAW